MGNTSASRGKTYVKEVEVVICSSRIHAYAMVHLRFQAFHAHAELFIKDKSTRTRISIFEILLSHTLKGKFLF